MTKKISLIVPAKNEVESLEAVLLEVKNNNLIGEIIVIVDDEFDNSVSIAKKFNCKLVVQKSSGYGSAIIEGFKNSIFELGCIFNAAHSFDPKYLDRMLNESHKNDFVFGTRYNKDSGSDDDTIVTFVGNKIFSFIGNKILKIKLTDILFTYVLCNVDKFKELSLKNKDFKLCIELPAKVKQNNFSYSEIPIFERKRYGGKKKVNALKDGFLILIEIIKNFGK